MIPWDACKQRKKWLKTKQWPLAGEFVEFEYSPKICHFWRVRVLAKTAIFRNMRDSPDSNLPKITFHDTRQTRIRQKLYFGILASFWRMYHA
jgi:hypothetical protein